MYYSEFTLQLIDEVKKHEILYNTRYEKRPKTEKDEAWRLVAESMNDDPEKCRRTWKNVRDRFVKVMHQRDRHFQTGGTELTAPQYVYFDKMLFMREFSLKKDLPADLAPMEPFASAPNVSPEHLVTQVVKTADGTVTYIDYTDQFLELVKDFPVLYDERAEMRKYRSRDSWRQIANGLSGKFTVGTLRNYWTNLMKKYKLYLEEPHRHAIENEEIFDNLNFVSPGVRVKNEDACEAEEFIVQMDEELDISEEHLVCEEIDASSSIDGSIEEEGTMVQIEVPDDEINKAIESIEEPVHKKLKTSHEDEIPVVESFAKPPQIHKFKPDLPVTQQQPQSEDEFDLFGKKVALQLRDLAQRSRTAARKGEIKVLQLLMELEESLDS